jgi:hypothetical protein
MKDQFPLWFVIPNNKAGATRQDGSAVPVVFSSAEKMATWLGSRRSENHWYVRLLDRDATAKTLNELRSCGCTEIHAELDGRSAGKISIADLEALASN